VSTRVGGTPEVVEDHLTGLLVPPGSPQALPSAVGALARSPSVRQELGDGGRRRLKRLFTFDAMVDRYLDVYHRFGAS